MPTIRPVSDLRNNFAAISRDVQNADAPIFLTRNGRGSMVLMSVELYEKLSLEREIYIKLKEAAIEANETDKRYSHEEVFSELRRNLSKNV